MLRITSWKRIYCWLFLLLAFAMPSYSQSGETELVDADVEKYEQQAKDLAAYFEYILNLLGDPSTSARDKEVLVTQSYLKIFRDAEVQVEDDLQGDRRVPTNKDIQAYLQDVDFFFKKAQFTFEIEEITHERTDDDQVYFLVSFIRQLTTVDLEGKKNTSRQQRFMEMNLDTEAQDLRIVSMYTTKLSENDALAYWWNEMSDAWKWMWAEKLDWEGNSMQEILHFYPDARIGDTLQREKSEGFINKVDGSLDALTDDGMVSKGDTSPKAMDTLILNHTAIYDALRKLRNQSTLDLSEANNITDLEPLVQMSNLETLIISGLAIEDLTPLRHLTELKVLHAEGSDITDLSPIRYATGLRELFLDGCEVPEIQTLVSFPELEVLSLKNTKVEDLKPLNGLNRMRYLDIGHTAISDISPIANLNMLIYLFAPQTQIDSLYDLSKLSLLEELDLSGTKLTDVSALKALPSLKTLIVEGSMVESLKPLAEIKSLETIKADSSKVTVAHGDAFLKANPQKTVLYQTEALIAWWDSIGSEWKRILSPSNDSINSKLLHSLLLEEEVDASNAEISSLEALQPLFNLRQLNASHTQVKDLAPLAKFQGMTELLLAGTAIEKVDTISNLQALLTLDLANTKVEDLSPLQGMISLNHLTIDSSQVKDISPLWKMASLRHVYADGLELGFTMVDTLHQKNSEVEVVYQTGALTNWWGELKPAWKHIFQQRIGFEGDGNTENLHKIAAMESLEIPDDAPISTLEPLKVCKRLKTLAFSDTKVKSLWPIRFLSKLENLNCSQNPISDLASITKLSSLKILNVNNTAVSSLDLLIQLPQLQELYCAGTDIKDIKALENLKDLRVLDCSNTNVRNLKPLEELTALKSLTCYNTKLNAKRVDQFKLEFPNVEVIFY